MSGPTPPSLDDLDDLDPGPVPGPDAEPSAAERARARGFGDLVDRALSGRTPAAIPAEDRALLYAATVLRAGYGRAELAPERAAAAVEAALGLAVDPAAGASRPAPRSAPPPARAPRLPWAIAAASGLAALAAGAALWLRPAPPAPATGLAAPPAGPGLPERLRSRPADALVGAIPPARSGDAAGRVDAIFADRLDGFRELSLRRRDEGGR